MLKRVITLCTCQCSPESRTVTYAYAGERAVRGRAHDRCEQAARPPDGAEAPLDGASNSVLPAMIIVTSVSPSLAAFQGIC